MTPQDIITKARDILNDNDSDGYRQSNDELLRYINDALLEASHLSPNLFQQTGDLTCIPEVSEQVVSFLDAQAFVKVIRIKNGNAVHECNMDVLQKFSPDWNTQDAGPAQNWMRFTGDDKKRFYITPPSPDVQVLEVLYVQIPHIYLTDELDSPILDVPAWTQPALVDYVVARAESKDDEHVDSGRATTFYQIFTASLTPQQGA